MQMIGKETLTILLLIAMVRADYICSYAHDDRTYRGFTASMCGENGLNEIVTYTVTIEFFTEPFGWGTDDYYTPKFHLYAASGVQTTGSSTAINNLGYSSVYHQDASLIAIYVHQYFSKKN